MHALKIGIIGFLVSLLLFFFGCKPDEPDNNKEVTLNELLGNSDGVEITPDPFGNAPLSAIASYTSTVPLSVKVKIGGALPVVHEFSSSVGMDIPVLGLYPDTVNRVEVTFTADDGRYHVSVFDIETDSLPSGFPDIRIAEHYELLSEEGMTLCTMLSGPPGNQKTRAIVFDSNGDIRWYLELDGSHLPMEYTGNGLLVAGSGPVLREYDMLGDIHNDLSINGYTLHHDVIELPNGNFACAVTKPGTSVIGPAGEVDSREDFFVEINRNTGGLLQEWDLREVLDVDRNDLTDISDGDWLHMNALDYHQAEDAYIISGRHQAVFKVDRNNDLVWILAPHQGWGESGWNGTGIFQTSDYLLTAVDASGEAYGDAVQNGAGVSADFDWPWGQHAVTRLPNGNLLMFDNGLNRHFQGEGSYSRAVEYQVDQANKKVMQVWEYGSELGSAFYSESMGDVDVLAASGNLLITSGNIYDSGEHYARVIELTYPGNQLVFDAVLVFPNGEGDQSSVYRSERMTLYSYYE